MAQSQCSRRIWKQALSLWGSARPEWRAPPQKKSSGFCQGQFAPQASSTTTTNRWRSHPLTSFRSQVQTPTGHVHVILQGVPGASQPRPKQVEGGEQCPPIPKPPHQRPLKSCGAMQNNWNPHTPKLRSYTVHPQHGGGEGGLGLPAPMTLFQTPSPATIINSKLFFFMTPNFSKPNSSFHHYLSHRSH